MLILLSAFVLSTACLGRTEASQTVQVTPERDTVFVVTADPRVLSETFADIAESVAPSVVTITSRSTFKTVVPGFPPFPSPFGFDPWFGMPFQEPRAEEYVREGLGSGVIITTDGFIATNSHVVSGAEELEVVLADGSRHPAVLTGTDPRTDLAVVRVDAEGLPAVTIGDSDSLRVGEMVLAIGSPFALSQTVTQGIVSFIGRSGVGLADFEDYIQTDAAINPGNSGGALVNLDGELVGINTAIASNTGGYAGVGFAIPSGTVRSITTELIEHGTVSRGWIGVMIQDLDEALADEFGVPGGIVVSEVVQGSPGEDAGLSRGDVIVRLDGSDVTSSSDFRNSVASRHPGDRVRLDLDRDGRRMVVDLTLGRLPGEEPAPVRSVERTSPSSTGWVLRDLDQRTARQLGLPSGGVLVASAEPGGRAARSGIRGMDVILEVDRVPVYSVDEAEGLVAASGQEALLLVLRDGHTVYVVLDLI